MRVGNRCKTVVMCLLVFCLAAGSMGQAVKAASSGDQLQEKTAQIVAQQTASKDSTKSKLKKLFAYVQEEYGYARKTGFEAYSGWEKDYALEMLTDGKGSCYHYAAAYAFLAKKATGCSVRIGVGQTDGFSGNLQKHAWAEVKISGKWYICDPNMDKYAADASKKYCLKKRSSLKNTYNKFKDTDYYNAG